MVKGVKYKTAEELEVAGYIKDYITNEYIPGKPENVEAKVVFEKRLHREYDYDLEQMEPEFRIQKGSTLIGPADIVVFHDGRDKTQDNIYIVVECKRKERTDGIQQLKSYLAPLPAARYGVWFNIVKLKKENQLWKLIWELYVRAEVFMMLNSKENQQVSKLFMDANSHLLVF